MLFALTQCDTPTLSYKLELLVKQLSLHRKKHDAHYTLYKTDYKCESLVLAFQLMRKNFVEASSSEILSLQASSSSAGLSSSIKRLGEWVDIINRMCRSCETNRSGYHLKTQL